jgi:YgiT-type zinc finger domain-containing protein
MCKKFDLIQGVTTITLERDELSLVLNNVPALVCPNCGEAYANESTAARLLETALEVEADGLQMEIRQYTAQ